MATRRTSLPHPTTTEAAELSRRWRAGDVSALHELVERNHGLAVSGAMYFAGRYGVPTEDLIATAGLALTQAARLFDSDRGPFAPFARNVIRKELIESISRSTRSGVAIGRDAHRRRAVFDLGRVRHQLVEDGQEVTPENIGQRLGVSPDIAAALDMATTPPVQLDQRTRRLDGEQLGTEALTDRLVDPAPTAEAQLIAAEDAGALHAALGLLPEAVRVVLTAVVVDDEPVGRVAKRVGMKRTEVASLVETALADLRELLSHDQS